MHQRLKERLVGAAVLVVIAVVFIPMLLTGPIDSGSITKTNIPERPTEKFNSKLVPITESLKPRPEESPEEVIINDVADIEIDIEEKISDVVKDPVIDKEPKDISKDVKAEVTPVTPIKDKQVGLTAWVVQLGSFSSKVNADKLSLSLKKSQFPAFVEPLTQNKKTVYRVRVGPEILRADADALLKKIKEKLKLDGIVVSYP